MTNFDKRLDRIIDNALFRIILAFGAGDKSQIPVIVSSTRRAIKQLIADEVIGENEQLHYVDADKDPDNYLTQQRVTRNDLKAKQRAIIGLRKK